MSALTEMTQEKWTNTSPATREAIRDNSALRSELIGHEGWRVEVKDCDGQIRRFIVGKSTGWQPCHLEIKTRRSFGGGPADSRGYVWVRRLERIR